MDEFFVMFVEQGGVVVRFLELLFGPILGGHVRVRLILWCSWFGVVKTGECLGDIIWHGNMYFPPLVIPIDGEADVPFSFPFVADGIIVLEGLHEVIGMLFADVFDAEIIDD